MMTDHFVELHIYPLRVITVNTLNTANVVYFIVGSSILVDFLFLMARNN